MNYYIQGNKEKAEEIKAAFKKLGCKNTSNFNFDGDDKLYFTFNDKVEWSCYKPFIEIIKTNPGYKELPLSVEPKFKVGDKVIYNGNVCTITFMDEVYYDFDGGVAGCRIELQDGLLSPAPKFEVGDWVAGIDDEGDMATEKIVSLSHNKVLLLDTDGCHTKYQKTELSNFHLWTIADAKDGDVLVTEDYIFIFKYILHGGVHLYCHYNIDDEEFDSDIPDAIIGNIHDKGAHFRPATKEQRDLLFAKMKEAGYQWDVGKKELRKIQPHYDVSSFHAGMPVLVRCGIYGEWEYVAFSHYRPKGYHFRAGGQCWKQCIPFDGNEHLLGTTDMCDEQYVNW